MNAEVEQAMELVEKIEDEILAKRKELSAARWALAGARAKAERTERVNGL